jgi:peptidoglycan/LPS O-acetylase OafA/YrhL
MVRNPIAPVADLVKGGLHELRTRPKTQIPGLDALRAMAVIFVLSDHFAVAWGRAGQDDVWMQKLPFVYFGWTGVDLFFVLSGYLIGKQLWTEFVKTGDVNVPRFLMRRGLRIWPLYAAYILVPILLGGSIVKRIPDMLFFSNYVEGGVNGGWSLSTEEQFYILIPLLIVGFRKRLNLSRWLYALPAIMLIVVMLRVITRANLVAAGMSSEEITLAMYFPFHLRSEALFVGLFLSLIAVLRPDLYQRRIANGMSPLMLGVAFIAVTIGLALRSFDRHVFVYTALGLVYGSFALTVLTDRSFLTRWTGWRVFYPIARLSYGVYLAHFIVLQYAGPVIIKTIARLPINPAAAFAASLFVGLLASLLVSTVTFVLIERPFLLLREHWQHRRRPQEAPAHSTGTLAAPAA